jgi:hypothetical protein
MSDQFEFEYRQPEALVLVTGPAAAAVAHSLFGELFEPGKLIYRSWKGASLPAAACWFPPDRLELRVAPAELATLLARLAEIQSETSSLVGQRLRRLISRLEAWSYADSDSGSGPAESMAGELRALAKAAPSGQIAEVIKQARDALDDGLPAEVVAATLERAFRELNTADGGQASGLEPSGSG